MNKTLSVLFLFLSISYWVSAQIIPAEGKVLRYRRIGFSFPPENTVSRYGLEVAAGTHFSDDSFSKKIIRRVNSKVNKIIAEVPSFGKQYTWRPVYYLKNGKSIKGALNHFSTSYVPQVDTSLSRLKVLKSAVKYKDSYVFVDGHEVLYDMKGAPVWFPPLNDDVVIGKSDIRDIKLSSFGTITYLQRDQAIEINYDGDTLWMAPNNGLVSGDSTEHYHHEFTRLSNGHYMVLGAELMFWSHRFGPGADSNAVINSAGGSLNSKRKKPNYMKIDFGTLIEYDSAGNVVWYWKSSKYFVESDLVNYKPEHKTKVIDVHENAFFFDEEHKFVYISFKNISRILKIKYPEGNVVSSYGEEFKKGILPTGNGLFCDQHACKHSQKGYLYLYNNNGCNDSTELPTVLIVQESPAGDSLRKIWEYRCSSEGVNINPSVKSLKARQKVLEQNRMKPRLDRGAFLRATSGGNVIELPDHSLFVSMNTQYGKLFIVNKEKNILWSAVPEKYFPQKKEWFISPQQYRSSIISGKELDNLIWNATK